MCLFLWVLAGLADVTKPPLQYLQAGVSHANFFFKHAAFMGEEAALL